MDRTKSIRTYEPTGHTLGLIGSVKLAYAELYHSRHVIWHLFVRDFVAQFRQKILGYFWIVLGPLLGIVPFIFMHRAGILNPGRLDVPYAVFVFLGMGIWGLFINAFSAVSGGMLGNADLIMRTSIPKIALSVTGLANVLYGLVVHIAMLMVILLFYQLPPSPWALIYPLVALPMILAGIGLGLMFAVIGAVARDVTSIATTVLGIFMYLCPVVYKAEFSHPVLQALVVWNPMTYLVNAPRSLLLSGVLPKPQEFALACLFSLVLLGVGIHAFYLIKDKVAERL